MTMTATMPSRLARLLGALPDAITAAACLAVWIAPLAFGVGAVKTVVLMMLMEFLLVHGAGFFTVVAFMDDMAKPMRLLAMAGLLLFYALFVGVFAWLFHAWWPVWVFLWLAIAKAAWIFSAPRDRAGEMNRQMTAWAFSVAAYLAAVFAGLAAAGAAPGHPCRPGAVARTARQRRMDRTPACRGRQHDVLLPGVGGLQILARRRVIAARPVVNREPHRIRHCAVLPARPAGRRCPARNAGCGRCAWRIRRTARRVPRASTDSAVSRHSASQWSKCSAGIGCGRCAAIGLPR